MDLIDKINFPDYMDYRMRIRYIETVQRRAKKLNLSPEQFLVYKRAKMLLMEGARMVEGTA